MVEVSNRFLLFNISLFVLFSILEYMALYLFFLRIRNKHSDLYLDMGRPSLYVSMNTNKYGWWPVYIFLFKRKYTELGDKFLLRVSLLLTALSIVQVSIFLLLIISIFVR